MLCLVAALVTRSPRAAFLPEFIKMYAGDALWASGLYFLIALLRPSAPPYELLVSTALISYAVEASQLYQADWIVELRHTFPLGYVLGYGFLWSDIVCYTAGALMAFLLDRALRARRSF